MPNSQSELEPTPIDELAEAWDDLMHGRCRVQAAYGTRQRHLLELASCASCASRPREQPASQVDPRARQMLECVLSGTQQKVVAVETNYSSSTVSVAARRAMLGIGLDCEARHYPMLLMVMYRIFRALPPAPTAQRSPGNSNMPRVINIFRPDACLQRHLTPSEYEVARDLVEGLRHEEIAEHRRTAKRTIANQVASIYRKLNLSGRNELMKWLASQYCESHATTHHISRIAHST